MDSSSFDFISASQLYGAQTDLASHHPHHDMSAYGAWATNHFHDDSDDSRSAFCSPVDPNLRTPTNMVSRRQHTPTNITPTNNYQHRVSMEMATNQDLNNSLMPTWHFSSQRAQPARGYSIDSSDGSYDDCGFQIEQLQSSPAQYVPSAPRNMPIPIPMSSVQDNMSRYAAIGTIGPMESMSQLACPLNDPTAAMFYGGMIHTSSHHGSSPRGTASGASPNSTNLEVCSLSGSDPGWTAINLTNPHHMAFPSNNMNAPTAAIFNPGQTLHHRTNSNSSINSPIEEVSASYDDVMFPMNINSPLSDHHEHHHEHGDCGHVHPMVHGFNNYSSEFDNSAEASPEASYTDTTYHPSGGSPASAPARMSTAVRARATSSATKQTPASKVPIASKRRRSNPITQNVIPKTTKPVIKKNDSGLTRKTIGAALEKRGGRRKGPLNPEQRAQAHEIRKLRACLRCKFLKKTCDKGEPCTGCRPSHARLWQVPCTRIDIKDIGFFLQDWECDYSRHVSMSLMVNNIKAFSEKEQTVYITHGFGHFLPITAREVYVIDDKCFQVDWIDTLNMTQYDAMTAKWTIGYGGISLPRLSEYLDLHLDKDFPAFVNTYFEGTPFLTQILKTAHKYYESTETSVIRKALKLVIAYTLTVHITFVTGMPDEHQAIGKVDDPKSRFMGRTLAPGMINWEVKLALSKMWRELQRDVLAELSQLYSSVYQGEKLKNWPSIFMVATILLAVWELMQFDTHYREPDESKVEKFCNDMESTPVGVIVGLFQAISQKLPSFMEWETSKHSATLNHDKPICAALTEVRQHIEQHELYLRNRSTATFSRDNFDSLSNKLLARLVIRAN